MDFNIELTEFPSTVHSAIYCLARGFIPLEYSLVGILDEDFRASCVDYHGFLIEMFSDMYDNAEKWYLPVREIDDFCGGKKFNGVQRNEPKKATKLLTQTTNAAYRYLFTIQKLALYGEVKNEKLLVSSWNFPKINKQVSTPVSPITLDKRLSAFERVGLIQTDNGFISTLYPKMFPALCALAERSVTAGCIGHNFVLLTADFRYLIPNHKTKPEDFINPLVTEERKKAEELHKYALESGLKVSIRLYAKVDYKYKGKAVMEIKTRNGVGGELERSLRVHIKFANHKDGLEYLAIVNERLEQESSDFQKEMLRKLWRCVACSSKHLGSRFAIILGRKHRLCGDAMVGFIFHNPNDNDVKTIKRLIQIRLEMIDTAKKKK